jgi:hypothetical protein
VEAVGCTQPQKLRKAVAVKETKRRLRLFELVVAHAEEEGYVCSDRDKEKGTRGYRLC